MFTSPKVQGVIDLGTPEQKKGLYRIEELVANPAAVSLSPTSPAKWKIYPRRNQSQSNTCVYQARAKAAGILNEMTTGEFVEYSAADYNKRSNRTLPHPGNLGAYPVEAFEFWRKEGIGLEILEPSQNINDEGVASVKQSGFEKAVAKVSLLDGYFSLPAYNFDMIISTLHATKKPIPLGFFGSYSDWNRNVPRLSNPALGLGSAEVRHEVCATPNYGIFEGKEGFTIEDSWGSTGIDGLGVRWITREYFNARNYIPGLVPTSFKSFEDMGVVPAKPKYKFTRVLELGMMNDADVVALQNVLKFENMFPANHSSTGNYFEITRKAVEKFQRKYEVASEAELVATRGERVGEKTIAVLNKLYN